MSPCVGGSKAPLGIYYIYALRRYFHSGEDSCISTNEAIRNFCGGYYRVDGINYLCHVRYGMFPCNKSLALGIYCGNILNGRDISSTYKRQCPSHYIKLHV